MTASTPNTIFLRLEGPLQSWGDTSKFVIRRSMDAPTKSGVLGLVCCAMGLSRQGAYEQLSRLNTLTMGARIDRPGTRWWDYHTVGAGIGTTTAAGGLKTGSAGTLITRREYLADASFLVALQGDAALIEQLAEALAAPKRPVFLGRKSCPPGVPIFLQPKSAESWTNPMNVEGDLKTALSCIPWSPRDKDEESPDLLKCFLEWRAMHEHDLAPADAEVWYDAPHSFEPPVHYPRLVIREEVATSIGGAILNRPAPPPRPRANYRNSEYAAARRQRLDSDHGLCVFCKNPATTVQHVTYRRAGGNESQDDLRSLCRLCHDAVTMIEYGLGMGLDRINPEDPKFRQRIIDKRQEIKDHRSLQTRQRRLQAEEVD